MVVSRRVRELMRDDPALLVKADREFARLRMERGIDYEGRPYHVALEPLIVDQSQSAAAKTAAENLHRVLEHVGDLYRMDETVRRFMRIYRSADRWLCTEPVVRPYVSVCRFDGVFVDGTYQIMETNTCCPGGVVKVPAQFLLWKSVLTSVLGIPEPDAGDQPFIAEPDLFVRNLERMHWRLFKSAPLGAAIVNLNGRYTNEVDLIAAGLTEMGVTARVVDAARVRCVGQDSVHVGDLSISLAYNKLNPLELLSTSECYDYVDAGATGRICFPNSLMAQSVLEDKAILALMSDPAFADRFNAEESAVIARHVPWTRLVARGETTGPDGEHVELPEFILARQDLLVLKPRNMTRGKGVILGRHTSKAAWEDAVGMAVRTRGHVVQKYLRLPAIDLIGGVPPRSRQLLYELDTFLFDGRFAGFLCRASLDPVVNVGRSGTVVPVIVG